MRGEFLHLVLKSVSLLHCVIRHCFLHCLVCISWPKKSVAWARSRQTTTEFPMSLTLLLSFIDSHAVYSTGISLAFHHFISGFGCGTFRGPSKEALVDVSVLCFCCGVIGCLSFLCM